MDEGIWVKLGLREWNESQVYLSSAESNDQVGNEGVLRFSWSVWDHGSPSILLGQEMSINGFSDASNLIHFQQQTVACLLLNCGEDPFRVRHRQIIPNNLKSIQG